MLKMFYGVYIKYLYVMIVRDMPKCIVSKRENCGYGGVTDRECVEKLGCCWDSSVRNVPWCFHGR